MSDSIVLPIYKSSVNRCRLYSFWKFGFSMQEYVYRGPPLVVFLLTRAGAIGEKRTPLRELRVAYGGFLDDRKSLSVKTARR